MAQIDFTTYSSIVGATILSLLTCFFLFENYYMPKTLVTITVSNSRKITLLHLKTTQTIYKNLSIEFINTVEREITNHK